MARTKAGLTYGILERLGDTVQTVWTTLQVGVFLDSAYQELAQALGLFVDWTYPENLPRGFSYTAPLDKVYGHVTAMGFDYGCANFTAEFERRLLGDDMTARLGPANHTCPIEATDGHLSDAGASVSMSATVELPATIVGVQRVVWDRRTCAALLPAQLARSDVRYETITGEVLGYTWRKDGIRTLRKYKVPAAQATTYAIDGTWGILRDPADLDGTTPTIASTSPRRFSYTQTFEASRATPDTGRATYTASWEADALVDVEETGPANHMWEFETAAMDRAGLIPSTDTSYWGIPRQIPGEHPIGDTGGWGFPRRPYADGTNVRVEHTRRGRAVTQGDDAYELPDRYADYLRDFALWKCLALEGPGQDLVLSAHYQARWLRNVARVQKRLHARDAERVNVFGGAPVRVGPPARPQYPSNYGSVVRR